MRATIKSNESNCKQRLSVTMINKCQNLQNRKQIANTKIHNKTTKLKTQGKKNFKEETQKDFS